MKKILLVFTSFSIILLLFSCKETSDISIETGEIQSVYISTNSEDNKLTRHYTSKQSINLVIDYIHSLTLDDIDSVNLDSYDGLIYNISVEYDDGSVKVYSNLENKLFKVGNLEWKKVDYEQAVKLEQIIKSTPSN